MIISLMTDCGNYNTKKKYF